VTELLQSISTVRVADLAEARFAPIYSFVPADETVAATEVVRKLASSLRDYMTVEDDPRSVLLADFFHPPAQLTAEECSQVVCMDLSGGTRDEVSPYVARSEAVFIVSTTALGSLRAAREKARWIRNSMLDEACGLLLIPAPGGLTGAEAEEITGLPVCPVLRSDRHISQLACWIGQE